MKTMKETVYLTVAVHRQRQVPKETTYQKDLRIKFCKRRRNSFYQELFMHLQRAKA